ncbi:MAG: sigma-70 family RNA polymerase sigma factor [Isosphaeraceae bacterium]
MAMGVSRGVSWRLQTLFDSGSVGDLPDGVLLERFLSSRDEAAFEALVTRHGPMVLRVCRAALGDLNEAEDAFQATFLVLVRRAASIRSRGSIASWLYGVASRVSARARVTAGRRGRHERASAAGRPSLVPAPAFEPNNREDPVPLLYDELARLPDRYREAVVLCYLEGHTCEAAARRLGRPAGTVKARLHRARGILRRRLSSRGVTLPAGLAAAGLASGLARLEAMPVSATLLRATVSAAFRPVPRIAMAAGRGALLAQGVTRMMMLRKLGLAASVMLPLAIGGVMGVRMLGIDASPGPEIAPSQPRMARVAQQPPQAARTVDKVVIGDDPTSRALASILPEAMKSADPYYFTFALIRLANARHAAGDRAGALEVLRVADQVARTVKNDHLRLLAMMRTAVRRGQYGDREVALATIESFAQGLEGFGPEPRYRRMGMVIDFLYEAGFEAEAKARLADELARVDAIGDQRIRDGGNYRFIQNQVAMGDYEAAFRQVERFTGDHSNYRQPLIDIIVRWKSTPAKKDAPLAVVERARALAEEITYPYPRALTLVKVAPALARAGDIEGALKLAREIGQGYPMPFGESARAERPAALGEIARVQAARGDVEGARKTLREAWALGRTVSQRDVILFERLRRVAEVAAEIGDVEAARMLADEIEDDAAEKTRALAALARAQVKAGDPKAAQATLDQALKQSRGIGPRAHEINGDPGRETDEATKEIAVARAEAGDVAAAVALVTARGSASWKSDVLAAIATVQVRHGDVPGALKTAAAIPESGRAGEAYCEIAAIQAREHGAEPVLQWATRLEPPAARAYALIGVVEGMAGRRK